MKVTLARTLWGWTPHDDEALRTSRRWKVGETVTVELKKPRDYVSLKRYQALLSMVYANTTKFKSRDQVHQYLKIRAGHCTQIVSESTGEIFLVADSIDYDTLDEPEFQEVWRRVVDVVCEEIIPSLKSIEVEYEIQKICGLAA